MRRAHPLRIGLFIAANLGLLLLLAAWIASRFTLAWVTGHGWYFGLDGGAVSMQYAAHRGGDRFQVAQMPRSFPYTHWYPHIKGSPGILVIPMWMLMIPLAVPLFFRTYRKYQQSKTDRPGVACTHCGYDLTGNTSGVCPECGTKR